MSAGLVLTERVGQSLAADEESKVIERFVSTARYEWMFWDMSYRQERVARLRACR